MGITFQCNECGYGRRFSSSELDNVGTRWKPAYVFTCPKCSTENHFALDTMDIDGFISQAVKDKYETKKQKTPIAERVEQNRVKEYWVQQYVVANYARLGFKQVKGPSNSGPDFQVMREDEWVVAEVEVVCENYITHKHHEDSKWDFCKILIVLSEKKPDKKIKKHLPKTIIHLDKAHFEEWYREAAKKYARDREREEPLQKAFTEAAYQRAILAGEIGKRFDISSVLADEEGMDDNAWLLNSLADEFLSQWVTSKRKKRVKLAEITPEAIDKFCESKAAFVYETATNLPVFYSLYCKKCNKTLVIRASRLEGFSDYETIHCPHCKINLGEIRADIGFKIVEEKKGNHGNRQWQGHKGESTGED